MRRVRVFGGRHLHSPGDTWARTPPENPLTVTLLRGSPPASLFAASLLAPRVWALRLVATAAIMCLVGFERGTEYGLIERASAIDLMELASDFGPLPLQVGAILVSGSGESLAVGEVRDALADRIGAIPRLRQQLVSTPPGCGRPAWSATLGGLDATHHLTGNYLIDVEADHATARFAATATHRRAGGHGDPLWTLGARYHAELHRTGGRWLITALTMTAIWDQGNQAILSPASPERA